MKLTEVRELAEELLEEHDYAQQGWTVRFVRESWRAGYCGYATKEIGLSVEFMLAYDEDDVRTIILHEIAHIIAGPAAGHEQPWKNACKQLGTSTRKAAPPKESAFDGLKFFAILGAIVYTGFTFGTAAGVLAVVVAALIAAPKFYRWFAPIDKVYKLTSS